MKHDLRKEFLMMQKIPNILPVMNSLKSNSTAVKYIIFKNIFNS